MKKNLKKPIKKELPVSFCLLETPNLIDERDRLIQIEIQEIEINEGLKLKKVEGLVNGKPTYASTFIFEKTT